MSTLITTPTLEGVSAVWDSIAVGYDELATPVSMTLAEDALRIVGLRPGMRLLDVAAGSGAIGIVAARRGAQVVATDIAPAMIDRLCARARAEGLAEVEGRVMDGHALELDDDSFDIAGSQNGVSLFPDLERGLRELVRVTKPGGRALVVAFGPPSRAEFLAFLLGAVRVVVPAFTVFPGHPAPLAFQLADPGQLRWQLLRAGLRDVRVRTVTWSMAFQSAAHFWDWASNSVAAAVIAGLAPQQASEVQLVLDGMFRERSGHGPAAVLATEMNVGTGTKEHAGRRVSRAAARAGGREGRG